MVLSKTMEISNGSDKVLWRFPEVVLFLQLQPPVWTAPSISLLLGYYKTIHSALKFALGHIMEETKGKATEALLVIAISEQLCRSTFPGEQKENIIDTITGA